MIGILMLTIDSCANPMAHKRIEQGLVWHPEPHLKAFGAARVARLAPSSDDAVRLIELEEGPVCFHSLGTHEVYGSHRTFVVEYHREFAGDRERQQGREKCVARNVGVDRDREMAHPARTYAAKEGDPVVAEAHEDELGRLEDRHSLIVQVANVTVALPFCR